MRGPVFRIATMDCSAEEAEIRRALEGVEGVRSLGFQLAARSLRIDADENAIAPALGEALRELPIAAGDEDGHFGVGLAVWPSRAPL